MSWSWRGGDTSGVVAPARDRGQATVEVAMLLPILAILLLGLIQIGLLVRGKVLSVHTAREAARSAAVGDDPVAGAAAGGLPKGRYSVNIENDGTRVRAVVTYIDPTDVPLVGALVPNVTFTSAVTMRVEDWPN